MSPRATNLTPKRGSPTRKANSSSTASQVRTGACARNWSRAHRWSWSDLSSSALSKPVSAILFMSAARMFADDLPQRRTVVRLDSGADAADKILRGENMPGWLWRTAEILLNKAAYIMRTVLAELRCAPINSSQLLHRHTNRQND